MSILSEFVDFMALHGFRPKGDVRADDKWHDCYYGDERGSKHTGRYTLKAVDGDFAIGCVFTFKDQQSKKDWHSQSSRKLSFEEKARIKRQLEAQTFNRQKAEQRRKDKISRLLTKAYLGGRFGERTEFRRMPVADGHGYLEKKQIKPHGIRLRRKGWELIIPLYGTDGRIGTVQRITARGKKYLFPGGKKKGCYFPFAAKGEEFRTILICEGFATGASIREATGLPVCAAIDTSNLQPVADALRKKFPDAVFLFCADNDAFTKNAKGDPWNPGIEKAKGAAHSLGGASVIWPEFLENDEQKKYTDFNDLHVAEGLEAVRTQIMDVVNEIEAGRLRSVGGLSPAPVADLEQQPPDRYEPSDEPPDYGDMPPHEPYEEPGATVTLEPIAIKQGDFNMRFRCLGMNNGMYYYFSFIEQRIVGLTAAGHQLVNLLQLDTLEAWESSIFGAAAKSEKKLGLYAFNAMKEICAQRGTFKEEDNVRGGGAWIDRKRVIINAGDRLYVEGKAVPFDEFESDYTYIATTGFMRPSAVPLDNREAHALRKICEAVTWEHNISGSLLAGWLVIAPICGALEYRPHIWVTGNSQSGKSTVINKIVRNVLGRMAMNYELGTTEAFIRQQTGYDARPLVYDEAEPGMATEGVVALARGGDHGRGCRQVRPGEYANPVRGVLLVDHPARG